jgi:guanine nucleotide-binding protein alpha-1 subunit
LVPPNEEDAVHLGNGSIRSSSTMISDRSGRSPEVFVRPGTSWKGKVARGRPLSVGTTGMETKDEAQEVLNSCWRDIMALWTDPAIREILRRRKVRLEEFPGLCVFAEISKIGILLNTSL